MAVIVCAHPPGYLPGVSVLAKVALADVVIWLDKVRFTTPGYLNRNQLPGGQWLTVPIERRSHLDTVSEVTLAEGAWQTNHAASLHRAYRTARYFDQRLLTCIERARPGTPLADFNIWLLDWIVPRLELTTRRFRQSDYPDAGGSLSSRLARMVREVGGTTYLSGPSDRLDPGVFAKHGIELEWFRYAGPNPTVVHPLFTAGRLPDSPRQEVVSA